MAKDSLKERLKKKRKAIEERSSSGNVHFPKEGTMRFRALPVGEEEEFGMEVLRPFFGKGITSFTSAATFGEDCPVETTQKAAKEDNNANLAKALALKKKFFVPCIIYKEASGGEPDTEKGVVLVQVSGTIYGEMIDSFLDPEWGDFTDISKGYDFKLKRTGTGKNDTAYSLTAMKPSATPKAFAKQVDLEKMVRATCVTYDIAEDRLAEFLQAFSGDAPAPDKKKKKKKLKRRKGDM